jgi:regulator of sigma E protease
LYLIAFSWADLGTTAWVWTKVLVGLGLVIFVHELGHFVVAKLCGVKCEKFYLGFDIGGLKLCKFTRGETEYGIGILPLGGYVKMLGQEDNPARLRAEIERARLQQSAGEAPPGPPGSSGAPERAPSPQEIAAAEQALFDPRSYLAKSVPQRMAIISAGVTMNVVFAFLAAMLAYSIGVEEVKPVIGAVFPGEAAWRAGLMPGDRVEEIAGRKVRRWDDLVRSISLGDIEHGVTMVIQRAGEKQTREITVYPDRIQLAPSIGVGNGWTTTLSDESPVAPGSAAALARPQFLVGDRIVKIGGEPITNYRDVQAQLALHPDEVLKVTVERTPRPSGDAPAASERTEEIAIEVPPAPVRDLGMVMEMGPITAIQADSPAAAAGIQSGDMILRIDGQPPEDPMFLPEWFRRRAKTSPRITLTVQREGQQKPVDIPVPLRRADRYAIPREGDSLSIPSLGIALRVGNRIERVSKEGPAAGAGLQAGDVVVAATAIPPDRESIPNIDRKTFRELERKYKEKIEFGKDKPSWPFLFALVQHLLPGSKVRLTLEDGRTVTLEPVAAKGWFQPDRGFFFESDSFVRIADSLREAAALGAWKTWDALTLVFRIMEKLGTGQVSPKALGGPVAIFRLAGHAASQGTSPLLLFLTLLSANLALLNFLPIPVLDGGHMVFLAYEGITRKTPNENVQAHLTFVGLILLLALLVWVCVLDFGIVPRF